MYEKPKNWATQAVCTAQCTGRKIGKAAKKGGSGVANEDAGCWWAETCGLRLRVSSSELPGNFPPAAPVNCLNSRILHRASRSNVGQIRPVRSPFAVRRSEFRTLSILHLSAPSLPGAGHSYKFFYMDLVLEDALRTEEEKKIPITPGGLKGTLPTRDIRRVDM
jgi:hypothetical protein